MIRDRQLRRQIIQILLLMKKKIDKSLSQQLNHSKQTHPQKLVSFLLNHFDSLSQNYLSLKLINQKPLPQILKEILSLKSKKYIKIKSQTLYDLINHPYPMKFIKLRTFVFKKFNFNFNIQQKSQLISQFKIKIMIFIFFMYLCFLRCYTHHKIIINCKSNNIIIDYIFLQNRTISYKLKTYFQKNLVELINLALKVFKNIRNSIQNSIKSPKKVLQLIKPFAIPLNPKSITKSSSTETFFPFIFKEAYHFKKFIDFSTIQTTTYQQRCLEDINEIMNFFGLSSETYKKGSNKRNRFFQFLLQTRFLEPTEFVNKEPKYTTKLISFFSKIFTKNIDSIKTKPERRETPLQQLYITLKKEKEFEVA